MYQNFIGIDIGKDEFFMAIQGQKAVTNYPNNAEGFKICWESNASVFEKSLVVLETTGGYEKPIIQFLQSRSIAVHRANTRKVKSFIRSYGQLGKSDKIDALGLALYGSERRKTLSLYTEQVDEDLRELVLRRRELTQMLVQEKNRRQAPGKLSMRKSFDAMIQAITAQLDEIAQSIVSCCASKPDFDNRAEAIKTVPGIGDMTAVDLLASLPELGRLNRKQIASLGNLAPHPNESGKKIGYRRTRGGRESIKPILFMAAMSATRTDTDLGRFYRRLTDEKSKKKMVALTALMRKILVIANARLRDYYSEKEVANS